MGSSYTFTETCKKCGAKMECYYHPSACYITERCPTCGTIYKIIMGFTLEEIKNDEDERKWMACHGCGCGEGDI